MEWSIHEVARSAGTTSRTLRHYGEIGLLPPSRIGANGYPLLRRARARAAAADSAAARAGTRAARHRGGPRRSPRRRGGAENPPAAARTGTRAGRTSDQVGAHDAAQDGGR